MIAGGMVSTECLIAVRKVSNVLARQNTRIPMCTSTLSAENRV